MKATMIRTSSVSVATTSLFIYSVAENLASLTRVPLQVVVTGSLNTVDDCFSTAATRQWTLHNVHGFILKLRHKYNDREHSFSNRCPRYSSHSTICPKSHTTFQSTHTPPPPHTQCPVHTHTHTELRDTGEDGSNHVHTDRVTHTFTRALPGMKR